MIWTLAVALTGCLAAAALPQAAEPPAIKTAPATELPKLLPKLLPPFVVEADGAPITAATGHAAPFTIDRNGDGLWDLVVGEFGSSAKGVRGGTCRIYLNQGSATAPKFGAFTLLQSDGKPASMESS